MDEFKLTNDIAEWMDFVYDVNNDIDGYKLVTKANIKNILFESDKWEKCNGKWFVCDEVRDKIVHNYEK